MQILFLKNLVIYSIKRFFFQKKNPITMSPESKLLVILSTSYIIVVVLNVLTKTELIFKNEFLFIHEINHIVIH